jgi:flagellar hook assembly protein FlgD
VPHTEYRIGFNSIYWDGKDQDGDAISNGTYLVKLIAKYPEKTKTEVLKLAKIK